jgi:hypothetical protein
MSHSSVPTPQAFRQALARTFTPALAAAGPRNSHIFFVRASHASGNVGKYDSHPSFRMKSIRPIVCVALFVARALPAATFTVSTGADSGAGSLRQALADAALSPGVDTVDFAGALSGQTITLTSGALTTADTEGVTLDATALAGGLTVSGGGSTRILLVAGNNVVSLRRLALTGGVSDGGGAISALPGASFRWSIASLPAIRPRPRAAARS